MASHDAFGDGAGIITPDDLSEIMIHNSDAVHLMGYNGSGVTVAVIDSGVDFAHPDFFNTTARVTDVSSDYFLHPMAHDGPSLNDYLVFGEAGPGSWFVNTSFSTTVIEAPDTTRWVNWTNGTVTMSWNVTGVAGLPTGEEVRVGFHPDAKLFILLGGMKPGLILFNNTGAGGPYDSVIVDLDGDFNMSDEKRAYINTDWTTFDPEAELLYQDLDGDGWQDISGGMVYFISDGTREIPYASSQIDTMNLVFRTLMNNNSFDLWAGLDPTSNLVPGDGNLTLLFGDLEGPGTVGAHGTWASSAAVGQGLTGGFGLGPVLVGQAPGAKILGVGHNIAGDDVFAPWDIFSGIVFAAEGYDGVADTGDEAQIASNSWGFGASWAGWDFTGRFVDYVSTVHADERILYVFSAGNDGPGMGARTDPKGGPSVLTVGAMESYLYRVEPWWGFDGGPNPSFGGTADFSTRGPSALGRHNLDVMASGSFAHGADPLNNNPFDGDSGTSLDGNTSWTLWGGTSLASPNAAGIAALVYQAYAGAHGGLFPMASTAKGIMKAAADDAGQDPLQTGAGLANALRGVLIAGEADGLTASLDEWNPGDYHGVDYAAYANILPAGGADMTTVTLTNHRPTTPMDVSIADAVLTKTGSLAFNFTRVPGTGDDQYLLNGTGILAMNGTVLVPGSGALWASADAIRISVFFDIQVVRDDLTGYLFRVYDWTDTNMNGSSEGVAEGNLMTQGWLSCDILVCGFENGPNAYMFVHDPAARTHDGLFLRNLVLIDPTLPFTVEVVVDYFEQMDSPWLSASVPMVMIPAASSVMVDLMATVPAEAKPGLYEGMYLFTLDNGNVTTLPVVVNVAAGTLPFSFGASSADSGHYQQGDTYGGDFAPDTTSGDYRYFFLDLPEPASLTVRLEWVDPGSVFSLFVLTNSTDWFSDNVPARYGPGTEETVASVDEVGVDTNTTSVTAPLNKGLSIIAIRNHFISGIEVAEHPRGEAGVIALSPPTLSGVGVPVEDEGTITITSELAFPDVQSFVESGSQVVLLDQTVDSFPFAGQDPFEQYLFEAPNRLRTDIGLGVTRADYVFLFHSGATDVDFGIFFDANCDSVYTVSDDVIGTSASTGLNPEKASVDNPAPGCYWVHAAGFTVAPAGGLYDMTQTLIEQPFVTATALPSKIDPGVPADVTLAWNLPHLSQTFGGTVFIGSMLFPLAIPISVSLLPDLPPMLTNLTPTPGAITSDNLAVVGLNYTDTPDAFETAVDVDSVVFILDGIDFSSAVAALANPEGVSLNPFAPHVLPEGPHTVMIEVEDENGSVNRTSWSFTVDSIVPTITITEPTVSLTNNPIINVTGTTEPGATVTVNGTPVNVDSSGNFALSAFPLAEGLNSIPVMATDAAGNFASTNVEITVDTIAPSISLSSPASGASVEVASVTVTGSTEPGALVVVNGLAVPVDANGAFTLGLALSEGSNTITATATDAAGNTGTTSRSVTYTNPVPGLQQDLDNLNSDLNTAEGNLATLNNQMLILIGLVVAAFALAGVGFVLWFMQRRKP